MNGRIAKKIRKVVYGDHVSGPKGRKYFLDGRTIVADNIRRMYQNIKRDYNRKENYAEDEKQTERKDQGRNQGTGPALTS